MKWVWSFGAWIIIVGEEQAQMGSRQEDTSVTENVNKADNINKYNKVERG